MRGLTPEEYAVMVSLGSPGDEISPAEEATLDELVEQGRAVRSDWDEDPENYWTWDLTPAGREALALYPLMLALQAQP